METINEIHKYNGFKLISLDLRDTTLMGKSKLFYNFMEPEDEQKLIYTTVIIGANGTGKSNLFRIIIELLKELEDLSKGKNRSYSVDGRFNLKFSIHGNIYEYSNIHDRGPFTDLRIISEKGNAAYLLMNGDKIEFNQVQLPQAIVANSIMLTDKYPFFRKETDENGNKSEAFQRYKYLGIRNIAQNASTRAYVRKTVEFIVQEFNSLAFRKGLERATTFLGLTNSIDIYYYTANNSIFFKGELRPHNLDDYFGKIHEKYPKLEDNPPYKLHQYLKIKYDGKLIQEICDFCNDLFTNNLLIKPNYKYSSIRKVVYNLIDEKSFEQLNKDFVMLEHLRQLGIISAPEIELKRADGYSLQESSSGEYHFFSSVVGLMATVKTDSLVFIDEPEISLHPNWQMKYLTFIRELFSSPEYATSHIFVATHSHFIISDLKPENSKIIGLKRENGKIEMVNLPEGISTYGWSAEEVLYSIFNVRSTRNSFLEYDLTKLVTLVNRNSNQYEEIRRILGKISTLILSDGDPLTIIKEKTEKYLQKNNA
jgi:predicted ATPase